MGIKRQKERGTERKRYKEKYIYIEIMKGKLREKEKER